MSPGVHDFASSEAAQPRLSPGLLGRTLQPLVTPAFPVALASDDSTVADALLRARLRPGLSTTTCVLGWIGLGACDLDYLIRDDALLDSPAPERALPALALHPFTPLIVPPSTAPFPPPRLQSAACYSQTFDSPRKLLIPQCFHHLQEWLDTLLDDLTTMRDAHNTRVRPQPFVRGQACFVPAARRCVWDLRGSVIMPLDFTAGPASPLNLPYRTSSLPEWPDAATHAQLPHAWGLFRG
eukprot:4339187-Pleurochrysis_carterae.AAC.1